jgi:hypothetical protein
MASIRWRVAVPQGIISIGGTIWGLATGVLVLGDRFFERTVVGGVTIYERAEE